MIELKGIRKNYGNRIVLDNINITILDHDFVAIVGESGSGKTTLLNIIGLLDDDYEGEVIIDGINLKKMKASQKSRFIRKHISYLFQNYALIEDDSILKNLLLALEYTTLSKKQKEDERNKALKLVGVTVNIHQKIYELSGGEQQRIALARTILKPSDIILADEPTGNLDVGNRDSILRVLQDLRNQGKTIVIVTHDPEIANCCDKVIKIKTVSE